MNLGEGESQMVEFSPALAPLGVELNSIGRIGHHEPWLAFAQQSGDSFGAGGVAAEHSVRPKQPQVAQARTGDSGSCGAPLAASSSSRASKPSISPGSNPVRLRSEIQTLDVLEFDSQELFIPVRPRHRAVHHQPERFDLRWRPLIAEYDWDLSPSLRAAFSRRCPSTTSPSLRTRHGISNPNSRIDAHMRSTAASFFLGFRM